MRAKGAVQVAGELDEVCGAVVGVFGIFARVVGVVLSKTHAFVKTLDMRFQLDHKIGV